jgi:4-amino-4-deoxy-L-arabinose transferase-like glycosyltransferase
MSSEASPHIEPAFDPRTVGPAGSRLRWTLAFAALMVVVAVAFGLTMRGYEYKVMGDGNWYMRYMTAVSQEGLGAFPALFDDWNTNKVNWNSPPPSRVGFILTSALCGRLFGATPTTLGVLSAASFFGWIVVNWLFARRRFGDAFALAFAALCAASPLLMGLSRVLLTDTYTTLCLTVTAWSFLELVEQPRSRRWLWIFGVSFAWVILVKELTVLLAGPLAAFVLVERFVRKSPLPLVRLALALAIPALCTIPVMVLAAGSPATLYETFRIVLSSPATNEYVIRFCSGPWYRYLMDYLLVSPWMTILSFCALGALVLRWRQGFYERAPVFFAVLAVGMTFEHGFFIKNLRYLAILELPMRLLVVWFLFVMLGRSRRALVVIAGVVLALCAADWITYMDLWVEHKLYDPLSPHLIGLRDIFPRKW